MENNNISEVISNALIVNKYDLYEKIKPIINQIKKSLEENEETFSQANKIDKKNNNGFMMDFNVIKNIFSNIEKESPLLFGDVTLSEKDDEKRIIYGTQIMDTGNVVVINDGNPYVIIEMAIRNIMAGNTTIFSNNGYMFGTNQLIIKIIQSVLEQFNISKYLVQIYLSEEFDDILANFANIDLVVCIGDNNLQRMILNKSKNRTITSGYENFEIYIDDSRNLDFLNKIIDTGVNIQLYIKENINLNHSDSIIVTDIDEAIAQINYTGSKYSAAIFTESSKNASKFIREVKAKIVTVNTSPTIERIIDINQNNFYNEKTIIYPLNYKLDGKRDTVEIK